jgi:hypothetical protein
MKALVDLPIGVGRARELPESDRREFLRPGINAIEQESIDLRQEGLVLWLAVGFSSPLTRSVEAVATLLNTAGRVAKEWLDGMLEDDECDARFAAINSEHTKAILEFQEAVYETLGWQKHLPDLSPDRVLDLESAEAD